MTINQEREAFVREDRYIVIKRSDLEKVPLTYRRPLIEPLKWLQTQLPKRECLVIESDWPEFPVAFHSALEGGRRRQIPLLAQR